MNFFVLKSRVFEDMYFSKFIRSNGYRIPQWERKEAALRLSPSDVISAYLEIDPLHPCDIVSADPL